MSQVTPNAVADGDGLSADWWVTTGFQRPQPLIIIHCLAASQSWSFSFWPVINVSFGRAAATVDSSAKCRAVETAARQRTTASLWG